MATRWLDRVAAHLFPSRCFGCEAALGAVQLLGACGACWGSLASGASPRCRRCALELPAGAFCARCVLRPPPFDRAVAAVTYDGRARRFLLRAKNGHRPELFRALGAQLAAAVTLAGLVDGTVTIVPVPSSPWARLRRGFEPARELSRELARALGLPAPMTVLRKRWVAGPDAKGLGAAARRAVAARSLVSRRSVPGARVLLIDDVLTTGATASACASALRAAGAVEVSVAVWARTPAPGSAFGG